MLRKTDTQRHSPLLPTGSIVAVQREDVSLLTLGVIVEHDSENHNSRSYKMWGPRLGCIITRRH